MVDGITSLDGSVYLVESNTSGDSSSVNAASFDEVYSAVASDEDLDYIFQDVAREYGLNVSFLKAVAQNPGLIRMLYQVEVLLELCSLCLLHVKAMVFRILLMQGRI